MSETTILRDLTGTLPTGTYVHEDQVTERIAQAVRETEQRIWARVRAAIDPLRTWREPAVVDAVERLDKALAHAHAAPTPRDGG